MDSLQMARIFVFVDEWGAKEQQRRGSGLRRCLSEAEGGCVPRWGCLVDLIGIEPMTSSMPWKRAPSCATGPLIGGTFLFSRMEGGGVKRRAGTMEGVMVSKRTMSERALWPRGRSTFAHAGSWFCSGLAGLDREYWMGLP
jgi:hypothetical protein